jgi:excisionase family DNA binding protein
MHVEDALLVMNEAATDLGIAADKVYSWVSTKAMLGYGVGRFWKFKRDEGYSWVRAGGPEEQIP